MAWNPEHYLTWGDERGRPFFDLMARVAAREAASVVDLGCGPGNLTNTLAQRWPEANVRGVDSSPEMIETARSTGSRVDYEVTDVRTWLHRTAPASVDVLVSNATLQWVPGYLDLLPALLATVRPDGWLALQVPGNHAAPSHALLAELAGDTRFAQHLGGARRPVVGESIEHLRALQGPGVTVDAWETTYLHVLPGEDAVFEWISATGARPTLEALRAADAGLAEIFEAEYRALLRAAYPVGPDGSVVLEFRRLFAVAHVSSGERS